MTENRRLNFLGPSLFREHAVADEGMLFERGMTLVVEIVQQASDRILRDEFVALGTGQSARTCLALSVGPHAGLDAERVLQQAGRLRPFVEQIPGPFAGIGIVECHSVFSCLIPVWFS